MKQLLRKIVPRPLRSAARKPGSTLAWAWHDLQHRLGRSSSIQVTGEWRVRCHPASRIVFEVHRDEHEFRDELSAFVRACTPNMMLLDVGAHLGFFTLAALHHGGPGARVIAVEPSAPARRILAANLHLAGSADRVTIVAAGLGSVAGGLAVLTTGAGGLNQMVRPHSPRPDTVEISTLRLDDLVADRGVEPTHVKIDVEGFEKAVLEGGRAYLARRRPVVFLELHGALLRQMGDDPAETLSLLEHCGYRVFESHGAGVSPHEAAAADLIRLVCRTS